MDTKKNENINKDILILFIFASGNSIFFSYGGLFPYTFTYCKHFDDTLRASYFLYNLLSIFAGVILGGYIVPYLYFIFGIKNTMLITAILYFIQCFFYVASTSWFYNFLMTLFVGILYQFQICTLNYYLSSKYDNGIQYSSYCYLGQNVNMFVTPLVLQHFMNPDNKAMDQISYGSGDAQQFFNWEISSNYPFTMRVIGLYSFILLFLGYYFIEEIESRKGNIKKIKNAIKNRDSQKLKQMFLSEQMDDIKNTSQAAMNRSSLVVKSQNEVSLNESLTDQQYEITDLEAESLSKKILWNQDFLILVLLMAFKNGSIIYYGNLIKAPIMATLNDDKTFARALTFSAFADLANKLISPAVWSNLGFFGAYTMHNILTTCLFIIILTFKFQSAFFVFLYVSLLRLLSGMTFIYSYNFLYSTLHPKVANYVTKILEANYTIGISFWFIVNSQLFNAEHLYTNLYVLISVNIIVTILFITKYKDYKIEKHLDN